MSLIKFCQPANSVREEEFLSSFFPSAFLAKSSAQWYPDVDVSEDKDKYTVQLDLPGVKKEDVQVSFEEGVLTVQGERKSETEQKDKSYYRVERSYGRFIRSFNLGTAVDSNNIQANYKDGVLEITIAKSEKAQPKAIDIKIG